MRTRPVHGWTPRLAVRHLDFPVDDVYFVGSVLVDTGVSGPPMASAAESREDEQQDSGPGGLII